MCCRLSLSGCHAECRLTACPLLASWCRGQSFGSFVGISRRARFSVELMHSVGIFVLDLACYSCLRSHLTLPFPSFLLVAIRFFYLSHFDLT